MAESHYERAAALFRAVEDDGEFLRCLLEQISLQEFLMEESHPSKKTLQNIFSLFVNALPTLRALKTKVQVSGGKDFKKLVLCKTEIFGS